MKICFIAEDYYYNGGGERILTLLCNKLVKYYDVSVLSLLQIKNKSNYSLDKKVIVKNAGIPRLCWGGFTKFSEFRYLKNHASYLESFDIIIGLGIVPNFLLGMIASRTKRPKLVGWEHGSYTNCSVAFKIIRRAFYHNLHLLVILTEFDLKNFRKIARNVVVINNFIAERHQKIIDPYKNKKFIFVGRIEKVKGIDYLCKILKSYYESSNLPWQCKIIGDGTYRDRLIDFIHGNKLDKVEMLLNSSTIEQEYRNASFLLLTSRFEGFPMVLLEAASLGLPVISFDCQTGPSEIIQDGFNGFLISQYNIELFVQKMIELQNNERKLETFSTNIYHTSERFLSDIIVPQWINVFNNLKKQIYADE
jgi:glycosyltransferase involved in cell wall biosynthesis